MKTLSVLIQIAALASCFTIYTFTADAMPGVRKALQTMVSPVAAVQQWPDLRDTCSPRKP